MDTWERVVSDLTQYRILSLNKFDRQTEENAYTQKLHSWKIATATLYIQSGWNYRMEDTLLALSSVSTAPRSYLSSASEKVLLFVTSTTPAVENLKTGPSDAVKVVPESQSYIGT